MSQFNDYATKSKWSPWINKGCDDRLRGIHRPEAGWIGGRGAEAYEYGWKTTDAAENKAGRPMLTNCGTCGPGPVFCRDCMEAA